jgi:DNA-directed RNA polymerase specialized sigma24 family protein
MRRLARQLVSEAGADDVVQESWLAAARRSPEAQPPPRRWLARVVGNFARMHLRGDERRRSYERELALAAPVEAPSNEVLLARMQTQRLVAELVMELDEPYRSPSCCASTRS